MTSGQILKKNLHLLNFPHTKIRRVVTGGSIPCYQIVYDSRNVGRPLTSTLLNANILAPKIVAFESGISKLPWVTLDVYNGALSPALFFVTDVAGFYGVKKNYSEKVFTLKENKLQELTIPELRNVDLYTSNTTQKYKDIRKDFQGQGIKNTKLIDSTVIPESGSLRFTFLTEATEIAKNKLSHSVTKAKVDQKKQFNVASNELIDNPSKTYDMYIQLDNVFPNNKFKDLSWLETYNGEVITSKMMKDLLEVADVKLFDTTPAFQYQGFRYRLSTIDAAIFPETRPDTFWKSKHGAKGFLDKHFSQILDSGTIQVFLNIMTSMLIKHCKELGYAKNIGKENTLIISIGDK